VLDLRRRRAHWAVRRRLSRRPRSAGPVFGAKAAIVKKTTEVAQPKAETVKRGGNKLSYNLQRELEQLPQKLEELEAELQTLQEQVADPSSLANPHDRTQQVLAQLAEAEQALEAAFERWEYLEGLKNGA
jgi:ATP-binding cassette subfamily F protein uup